MRTPKEGEIWQHRKSSAYYMVIGVANAGNPATDDNNPPIVVYKLWNIMGLYPEAKLYARTLESWQGAFTPEKVNI